VRIIVTFAAGGPNDIIARLMGRWLSEGLDQQFVIENRPGAGGTVGSEVVVNAPPDGYTLILASPANAINATLYENLSYNFIRGVTPVAGIAIAPSVMEVHPLYRPNRFQSSSPMPRQGPAGSIWRQAE
jgi:tripartite-type tricarboxylate transporter receptor subunit TctC